MTTIHGSTPPTYTPVNGSTPAVVDDRTLEAQRLVGKLVAMHALMGLIVHHREMAQSLQSDLSRVEAQLRESSANNGLSSQGLELMSLQVEFLKKQVLGIDHFASGYVSEEEESWKRLEARFKSSDVIDGSPADTQDKFAAIRLNKEIHRDAPGLNVALQVLIEKGVSPDELSALKVELNDRATLTRHRFEEIRERTRELLILSS